MTETKKKQKGTAEFMDSTQIFARVKRALDDRDVSAKEVKLLQAHLGRLNESQYAELYVRVLLHYACDFHGTADTVSCAARNCIGELIQKANLSLARLEAKVADGTHGDKVESTDALIQGMYSTTTLLESRLTYRHRLDVWDKLNAQLLRLTKQIDEVYLEEARSNVLGRWLRHAQRSERLEALRQSERAFNQQLDGSALTLDMTIKRIHEEINQLVDQNFIVVQLRDRQSFSRLQDYIAWTKKYINWADNTFFDQLEAQIGLLLCPKLYLSPESSNSAQ